MYYSFLLIQLTTEQQRDPLQPDSHASSPPLSVGTPYNFTAGPPHLQTQPSPDYSPGVCVTEKCCPWASTAQTCAVQGSTAQSSVSADNTLTFFCITLSSSK